MPEKMDLLLVDGPHALYRAAFAAGNLTYERKGVVHEVGGAFAMLTMLRRLHPEWGGLVVVAWEDPKRHIRSYRRQLYPVYKTTPDDEVDMGVMNMRQFVREQQSLISPLLSMIGIPQVWSPEFEADDVIAALCKRYEGKKEIAVMTGDKDMFGVIRPGIRLLRPQMSEGKSKNKYEVVGVDEWTEGHSKWPKGHLIETTQWSEVLTLWGDTADGIPGVKGIGPVTAEKLLVEYGSVLGVIEAAKKGEVHRFSEAIVAMESQLMMNLKLAALYPDAPLEFVMPNRNPKALRRKFREMKMSTMLVGMEFDHLMEMGCGGEE